MKAGEATIMSRADANQEFGRKYRIGRGKCGALWIWPQSRKDVQLGVSECPCACGTLYLTTWGKSLARVLP